MGEKEIMTDQGPARVESGIVYCGAERIWTAERFKGYRGNRNDRGPYALCNDINAAIAKDYVSRKEYDNLVSKIEELSAEGYLCGRIEQINGVFKGGCGENVNREESYRCADCTASFHRECIRKHFKEEALGEGK